MVANRDTERSQKVGRDAKTFVDLVGAVDVGVVIYETFLTDISPVGSQLR